MRIAYGPSSPGGADALVGARGVAQRDVDPAGKVQVGPELFNAELAVGSAPIAEGAAVRIREVRGLTLVVEPEPEPEP